MRLCFSIIISSLESWYNNTVAFVLVKSTKTLMKRDWRLYHLYLYCECIISWISNLYSFLSSFPDSLLSPYSIQTSFIKILLENKLSVLLFLSLIQINHEKNLKIYVLCHSCKCEICSKWCKHEIYSKLTIKTPLLMFSCLIANVSVVNLSRYFSSRIMIF